MRESSQSIHIDMGVDTCFRHWDDFQRIVYIIDFVHDAHFEDTELHWEWAVKDNEGHELEWETVITDKKSDGPDRSLSFQSVPDAPLTMRGTVQFEPHGPLCTTTTLTMALEDA